jgi:hypothetical protein
VKELVRESIRYFHHPAWLNTYCRIDDRNLLGIDDRTEALLARYGEKGKRTVLLIVVYFERSRAEKAFGAFRKGMTPGGDAGGCARMEDGTWTAFRLREKMIIAAFKSPSREEALRLLDAVPGFGLR